MVGTFSMGGGPHPVRAHVATSDGPDPVEEDDDIEVPVADGSVWVMRLLRYPRTVTLLVVAWLALAFALLRTVRRRTLPIETLLILAVSSPAGAIAHIAAQTERVATIDLPLVVSAPLAVWLSLVLLTSVGALAVRLGSQAFVGLDAAPSAEAGRGSSTAPAPDVARIALKAIFACVATDLALVGMIALLGLREREGTSWSLAAPIWAYAVGHGLGAGAALAIAETALRYRGLVWALVAGLLCSGLAPLGGAFELALVQTWSVPEATHEVVDAIPSIAPTEWAWHAAGAAGLLGPLLVAISRRARRSTQALAMAGGGVLWCGAHVAWPDALPAMTPGLCGMLAIGPALILPPARTLGDVLAARFLGREVHVASRRAPRRVVCVLGLVGLVLVVGVLEGPNETVATAILRLRARLGDREAMLGLADLLCGRVVVPPPPTKPAPKSLGWALRAQGLEAPVVLEFPRVTDGESFRRNFSASRESARHWYRTAACHGELEAMVRLADLLFERSGYHMGLKSIPHDDLPGAIADVQEAISWLRQAAVGGHVEAAAELGKCLRDGWTSHHRGVNFAVPSSAERREEGDRWLRFAAEHRWW